MIQVYKAFKASSESNPITGNSNQLAPSQQVSNPSPFSKSHHNYSVQSVINTIYPNYIPTLRAPVLAPDRAPATSVHRVSSLPPRRDLSPLAQNHKIPMCEISEESRTKNKLLKVRAPARPKLAHPSPPSPSIRLVKPSSWEEPASPKLCLLPQESTLKMMVGNRRDCTFVMAM
ncbi:uncharacterized protein CLUP02_05429 [Colletotrichum lupini]|uniref:Uncharacterized protein n=1 Tax=Colletotrichum lupini TaxID=145971 RepID=A0A9Q8SMH1_9PEZI|nr:uncharacterized protein CLUP02_05429 [Colletotrichum lupini]UQC79948.1 hypothetical protein CLUP02_05429 [Colletotrichum lupini]